MAVWKKQNFPKSMGDSPAFLFRTDKMGENEPGACNFGKEKIC